MIAGSIEIQLMAGIARLQKDMDQARGVVNKATSDMGRAANAAKNALMSIGAGFSLAAVIAQVTGAQRRFDVLNSSLITATGSVANAGGAFKALSAFASSTPYALAEVTQAFVKLRNMGMDPSEAALKSYGNTAAAMGKSLNQMVEAVADAATGEFERLKEFGIKAKQNGDQVSLTFQGVSTTIGNNARDIEKYLQKLGEAEFAGGMELRANTLDGAISNLGDAWENTMLKFAQTGGGDLARESVIGITGALTDLTAILDAASIAADKEGDSVRKMGVIHKGLTTVFEAVAVLGINIAYTFTQVGKELGGLAAQAKAVLSGDLAGAKRIGEMMRAEAAQARKDVDARTAAILGASAKAQKAMVEEADTRKKTGADALAQFRIEQREAAKAGASAKAIAEAKKLEAAADKARLKAAKEIADAAEAAIKMQAEYGAKLGQSVAEANREAEANEELARTFGMSKAAIEAENIARMEERVERLRGIDMADDEIAALELVIAAKKRSATAMSSVEAMAASKKATEDTAADYKKMSESIRDSLTDALLRGFESGKSFGRNLIDTLKNMFKTLVLQPTIQGILAPIAGALTGALGMTGTAQAATSGGGSGVGTAVSGLGMLGSLTSGAGLLGAGGLGIQAGFGALMSGGLVGISGAVSGGIAAIGAGTGASIAAGMGTIAGALGPIALGIGAAVALLNKAFGRGPKEVTSTTMNGSFGANGFSGTTDAAWKKEGGWLRSDKTGVDKTAIDAAVAKEFAVGYDAIKTASADFANVLGLNADSIKNRSQSLSIALTKDEEANKKAIADFFIGVGNSIATELLPTLGDFAKEGEGASATLQRLATNYATIDAALTAIGLTFGAVGVESLAARERLVELSGGIEALAQNAAGFAQNFLTEAERVAPVAAAVTKAMAELGFASVDTRDEFKALVQGLDLTTESGATNYAALMKLQGAFAQVYPAIESTSDALDSAADAIQTMKDAASALMGNVDGAMGVLQRVVDAEKTRLTKAHEVTMKALQQRIDTETAGIAKHKALSDAIASTLGQMSISGNDGGNRVAAQAQITAALAMARAGDMPAAESLNGALSILSKDSTDMFATMQDYQRDFYRTQNELAELDKLSDVALSVEEKTLAALIDQKDIAQAAFDAEIARLDGVLESAQKQIDILNGIDTSGITIIQALEAVRLAILSAQQNPVVSAAASINNAYKSSLGRAPDAAGMEFFQGQAASGTSIGAIVDAIKNSPEAKAQGLFQSVLGRTGDASGIAFWTNALAGGMSEQAAREMMMQSDEFKRMPRFEVGANYIPNDMMAILDEGERVIPAADNRELMARLRNPSESNGVLVAAVERLSATVDRQTAIINQQQDALNRTANASKRLADGMEVVTDGFNAMRTKEEEPV